MAGDLTTYAIQNVVLSINGRRATHFVEGDDVIMLERNTDRGTPSVGADGRTVFSISADNSATLTIKLQHTSPMHDYLTRLDRAGDADRARRFPVSLKDTNTGEGGSANDCVIQSRPSAAFGASASEREWVIFCPRWEWNSIAFIEA